jgi:hypothetical protein
LENRREYRATWVYAGSAELIGPFCGDACADGESRRLKQQVLMEARMARVA